VAANVYSELRPAERRLLGEAYLHEAPGVQRGLGLVERAHEAIAGSLDHPSAEFHGGIA
jgi:hypothetical protein